MNRRTLPPPPNKKEIIMSDAIKAVNKRLVEGSPFMSPLTNDEVLFRDLKLEIERLEAQNERYREALEEIAGKELFRYDDYVSKFDDLIMIARAALKDKEQ
jgi:hypothetical protein